jgi:prolyl 4-hydroxylase
MGTLLLPNGDFGTPQMVSYEKGERFDIHHDWYDEPQILRDGTQGPDKVVC